MDLRSHTRSERIRALLEASLGAVFVIAGVISAVTNTETDASGGPYLVAYGPMMLGLVLIVRAAWSSGILPSLGYKSFVAWRYLLVPHPKVTVPTKGVIGVAIVVRLAFRFVGGVGFQPQVDWHDALQIGALASMALLMIAVFWGVLRHSKPSMVIFLVGISLALVPQLGTYLIHRHKLPFVTLDETGATLALQILGICQLVGGGLAGLATFFGSLRAFFTFFTTVPIGGVWIGTSALVCVLAVMSGFESDLREKILGSNAHIQITREDGDFVEWREAKTKIDHVQDVVASTPYAVSEVVIAAHNNGMNVIIKGIDPATVGRVTDLVSDLEDREAMTRLSPIVDETHDRTIPQVSRPAGKVVDPPPGDMPNGGEPIDFSVHDDAGSAAPPPRTDPRDPAPDLDPDHEPTGPYGGDATSLIRPSDKAVDPAPSDLITTEDPPADYSHTDLEDTAIKVIDLPMEPTMSRRTQALPGVLVGRELVKQTHLYTGEEVRVVSPLSDPSNPDATGTPIPFNRDYRVAGIFYTGMYEYDLKYVYVTLDSLQDFLDRGDAVDGIEVRITDPDDTERIIPKLHAALGPGYRIQDWHELNRSLFSALKLEKIAMFLVLGIVILVASFSIVGNLIMVVVEKAREIALLKTLGASDLGVMQLFAIQGLLIGLIGTALGVSTGLLGCWAGKRFGLPLNPDVYYIDRLPIHVDPQSVAAAAAAGILISIAATLYPALLAARVRPAAGMRH